MDRRGGEYVLPIHTTNNVATENRQKYGGGKQPFGGYQW